MCADDLVYRTEGDKATPVGLGVQKVFAGAKNVLIGSAGLMYDPEIEYRFDDWVTRFIESRCGISNIVPSAVATALFEKMVATLKPLEALTESAMWKDLAPGDRLVSYVVAGYTTGFRQHYLFELGIEINERHKLAFISPMHKKVEDLSLGEDEFMSRAMIGKEPQYSEWMKIVADVGPTVADVFPQASTGLQAIVAPVIGFIKIEAKFNPNKVGNGIFACLIDRRAKSSYTASF
jgi:hypothetical protein